MNIVLIVHSSAGEIDWARQLIEAHHKEANVFLVVTTKAGERSLLANDFIREKCQNEWTLIGLEVLFLKVWGFGLRKSPDFISNIRTIATVTRYLHWIWNYLRLAKIDRSVFTLFFFDQGASMTFPLLRSFILRRFPDKLILYTPHSPHLYAVPSDRMVRPQWDATKFRNLIRDKSEINVFAWHGDDGRLAAKIDSSLPWVVVGYPKSIRTKEFPENKGPLDSRIQKVAVLSRGVGSYICRDLSKKLKSGIVNVAIRNYPKMRWSIKLHPRESSECWENVAGGISAIKLVDTEVVKLICESDLVISMWSSAALDCYYHAVPCIEFFDHEASAKIQIDKGSPAQDSMMYRDLGIVIPADDEDQLSAIVESMASAKFVWDRRRIEFLDAAIKVHRDFVIDVAELLRGKQTGDHQPGRNRDS